MTARLSTHRYSLVLLVAVLTAPVATAAQTRIALDPNRYSLQQDIELGQEAAADARPDASS